MANEELYHLIKSMLIYKNRIEAKLTH